VQKRLNRSTVLHKDSGWPTESCIRWGCRSPKWRGQFWNHMRDLYQSFCMLLMVVARSSSGIVTKSQGKGQFCGFSSPLTIHGIWDPYKNGLTDRDAVWDYERASPEELCIITLGDNPRRGRGNFKGKHVPDKPSTLTLWIAN